MKKEGKIATRKKEEQGKEQVKGKIGKEERWMFSEDYSGGANVFSLVSNVNFWLLVGLSSGSISLVEK